MKKAIKIKNISDEDTVITISLSPDVTEKMTQLIKDKGDSAMKIFEENLIRLFTSPIEAPVREAPADTEKIVSDTLNELGISAGTKGYSYLRDAVVLTCKSPQLIERVTGKLYPEIASLHASTCPRVERAMRHAIESCMAKGNSEAIEKYFSACIASERGKPTNSQFIAIISDKIRLGR